MVYNKRRVFLFYYIVSSEFIIVEYHVILTLSIDFGSVKPNTFLFFVNESGNAHRRCND